jgi:8-oxo-dGTP diphosphatase/2-hydroxy-dATP diphosphatase
MPTTRTTTLCFLLKPDEVLLAMKKRGFGIGKWNGCGGKLEAGESIEAGAARELSEEVGARVQQSDLQKMAELTFHLPTLDVTIHCHVFTAEKWTGDPAETEEMSPRWFKFAEIPFAQMWSDDKYWLPEVLAGRKIRGEFWFRADDQTLDRFTIVPLA